MPTTSTNEGYLVYVCLFIIWTVLVASVALWWGRRHPKQQQEVADAVDKARKAIGQ